MKNIPTLVIVTGGGAERFPPNKFDNIFILCKKLNQKGFKVIVVDSTKLDAPVHEVIDDIEIIRVHSSLYDFSHQSPHSLTHYFFLLINRFTYALSINKLIKTIKPKILCIIPTTVALFLLLLNPSLKNRTIYITINAFRVMQNQSISLFHLLYKKIEDFVIKMVPYTIIENSHVRNVILQQTKVSPEKLHFLAPIVDLDFWRPTQTLQKLEESSGDQKYVYLLYHGRIIPRKGVEYLINAMNIIVNERRHNDVRLLIVGPGDLNYVKGLQSLISTYSLENYVQINLGWQSEESLRKFYEECDIYVLPTLGDLAPNTVRQAMAMGKPTVTTTILRGYVITDGEEGFLVPPGNEMELANKLEILITNPFLRREMGVKARQKAVRDFSGDLAAERIKSIFYSMLNHYAK